MAINLVLNLGKYWNTSDPVLTILWGGVLRAKNAFVGRFRRDHLFAIEEMPDVAGTQGCAKNFYSAMAMFLRTMPVSCGQDAATERTILVDAMQLLREGSRKYMGIELSATKEVLDRQEIARRERLRYRNVIRGLSLKIVARTAIEQYA